MGDFNTPLTPMDRTTKQKINKETQTLNDTIDQLDLIDIYRTFHPKTMNFTFFSSAHRTFSRITSWAINLALVNSKKLKSFQASFLTQCHKIRSQLQEKKIIKNPNIWRLNNTLLNNQQITKEIKK